ncbi:helix-turn-helix transcriptional regulator [Lentzea flaviverrucosa]|uniref:ATP-, maltotriose-and DNA-dependent transcriptional regulator MalT n=1 Tax=Lentzea flaviverrucosa TaxID=200379 RepID=A0A1H9BQ47_9PSEU|nr:LuxR family transcriptional regulator [Lentzea flaviverrucosa]RDI31711.1 ATP/maltotriose-dependent transcriptional regulator MalT [Lentzea flaviverrucosa]SEP90907.1 ATP-, maltotriose-and DNA-dependent transcriptional regulator MalT [Lentzea flaviverrucosa]
MSQRNLEDNLDRSRVPGIRVVAPPHGREAELRVVEDVISTIEAGARANVVVLQSDQGSGKTWLLERVAALAARRGFAVVDGMSPSVATGRPVSLVGGRTVRGEDDRIAVLAAGCEAQVCGRLRNEPVLVVLDDVHWVEPALLHAIGLVMAKLGAAPVLWVFALDTAHAESANGQLLHSLVRRQRVQRLGPLERLSGAAVVSLVQGLTGATPDPDVIALCESVGGEPQSVVDLVLALRQEQSLVVNGGVVELADGALTTDVPSRVEAEPGARLPAAFVRMVRSRLGRLSLRCREVLQVAAVLGDRFPPQDLAEMLGERTSHLLGPLQEAIRAGVIDSDGDEFTFHREPVWLVVLGTVPALLRSLLHRQAATMLVEQGRADAAAVHVVHFVKPGDEDALRIIRDAAAGLLPTAPRTAAALAIRGLEIAPPGSDDRLVLATSAVAALVRMGNLGAAVDLATEQLGTCGESASSSLRTWLATALMLRGDESAAQGVLAGGGDTRDPLPDLLLLNTFSGEERREVVAMAERVLAEPGSHGDAVRAAALTVRARVRWREGELSEALATAEEAIAVQPGLPEVCQVDPLWMRAWMLTRVRRLDDAFETAEQARRVIDEHNLGVLVSLPLALRAEVRLVQGDLAAAEADATAGLRAAERAGTSVYEPQLRAVLVMVSLRRGDLAAATRHLRRLEDRVPGGPPVLLRCLLSALLTAAGRGVREAMGELREVVGDACSRRRLVLEDPSSTSWVVRTALGAGEADHAELVVVTAEEIAAGNPGHSAFAAAARHGRALLEDDVTGLAGLEDLYGEDVWAAASLVEDRGSMLRAEDRDRAMSELDQAMERYDDLGAAWDAARVRRKLRRLGVRRRHWNHETRPDSGWESLTTAEGKVAALVAQGMTNQQVATGLFVSPHTVGFHLRQIYRKLGIRSRVDLARIAP